MSLTRILRLLNLEQRLWARPLAYCLIAIFVALAALAADLLPGDWTLPAVDGETIDRLLSILSSTMLAVATFAVGSMVSAYAAASSSATPRAFVLVLADDVSQSALSTFVGAFIFSLVATIALKTDLYGDQGIAVLFVVTLGVYVLVIGTFVRWVDNIARLGRMQTTIETVTQAAEDSLRERLKRPHLGARAPTSRHEHGAPIRTRQVGYVQFVDVEALQRVAEAEGLHIHVEALPGAFVGPGRDLATVEDVTGPVDDALRERIVDAFLIRHERGFRDDPRFGIIVLSEIAARALSPAVNDPGTAIAILGRLVRLLALWADPPEGLAPERAVHDRVTVPALELGDLFDDAFTAISRDGAGMIEVGVRLQKAFIALSQMTDGELRDEARRHSAMALARGEAALGLESEREELRRLAGQV